MIHRTLCFHCSGYPQCEIKCRNEEFRRANLEMIYITPKKPKNGNLRKIENEWREIYG